MQNLRFTDFTLHCADKSFGDDVKIRFQLSISGVGPEVLHSSKLPDVAAAAAL